MPSHSFQQKYLITKYYIQISELLVELKIEVIELSVMIREQHFPHYFIPELTIKTVNWGQLYIPQHHLFVIRNH